MNTLTRKIFRKWLEDAISDISESVYAAGWHSGIEFDVWDEIAGRKALPETIRKEKLDEIFEVANELNEWVHNRRPIALTEWRKLVAARRQAPAQIAEQERISRLTFTRDSTYQNRGLEGCWNCKHSQFYCAEWLCAIDANKRKIVAQNGKCDLWEKR